MSTEGTLEGLLPDLEVIRKDFPILSRTLAAGQPLVYLDSANTSQKPQVVIDAMVDHLERHNANIARAMHQPGAEATAAYESARRGRGVPQRSQPGRGDLHQERHRGAQLVAQTPGSGGGRLVPAGRAPRSGRPGRHQWRSTTPTSCPGSCSPSDRRHAAVVWADRSTAGSTSPTSTSSSPSARASSL
ncbi:MAG: aminotransferase class V-fold PLP-dependent enzyme [Nocardioides sp.]